MMKVQAMKTCKKCGKDLIGTQRLFCKKCWDEGVDGAKKAGLTAIGVVGIIATVIFNKGKGSSNSA